ncbi:MAG: hypothetical protein Q9165_006680 [Trypethelium subeluteriae]
MDETHPGSPYESNVRDPDLSRQSHCSDHFLGLPSKTSNSSISTSDLIVKESKAGSESASSAEPLDSSQGLPQGLPHKEQYTKQEGKRRRLEDKLRKLEIQLRKVGAHLRKQGNQLLKIGEQLRKVGEQLRKVGKRRQRLRELKDWNRRLENELRKLRKLEGRGLEPEEQHQKHQKLDEQYRNLEKQYWKLEVQYWKLGGQLRKLRRQEEREMEEQLQGLGEQCWKLEQRRSGNLTERSPGGTNVLASIPWHPQQKGRLRSAHSSHTIVYKSAEEHPKFLNFENGVSLSASFSKKSPEVDLAQLHTWRQSSTEELNEHDKLDIEQDRDSEEASESILVPQATTNALWSPTEKQDPWTLQDMDAGQDEISQRLSSPTRKIMIQSDEVSQTNERNKYYQFLQGGSLDAAREKQSKKSALAGRAHSSQPVLRHSFSSGVALLASLPDDDDEGGIDIALAKLEGRYERMNLELFQESLDSARNSEGSFDPAVSANIERDVETIWARIMEQPQSYLMTKDELSLTNCYRARFERNARDSAIFRAAIERYNESVTAPLGVSAPFAEVLVNDKDSEAHGVLSESIANSLVSRGDVEGARAEAIVPGDPQGIFQSSNLDTVSASSSAESIPVSRSGTFMHRRRPGEESRCTLSDIVFAIVPAMRWRDMALHQSFATEKSRPIDQSMILSRQSQKTNESMLNEIPPRDSLKTAETRLGRLLQLKWRCVCGQSFEETMEEFIPGTVQELASELGIPKSSDIGLSPLSASQSSSSETRPTSIESSSRLRNSFQGSEDLAIDIDGSGNMISDSLSARVQKYILLCLSSKGRERLEHADMSSAKTDRCMYTEFHRCYFSPMRRIMHLLTLRKLDRIEFTRFQLYNKENVAVEVGDVGALPPDTARDYEYHRKHPYRPLIPLTALKHWTENPSHVRSRSLHINRVPMKISGQLHWSEDDGELEGWGLRFRETISWTAVWISEFFIASIATAFAIVWCSRRNGDLQDGFTVAGVLLAYGTIFLGLVQGFAQYLEHHP